MMMDPPLKNARLGPGFFLDNEARESAPPRIKSSLRDKVHPPISLCVLTIM